MIQTQIASQAPHLLLQEHAVHRGRTSGQDEWATRRSISNIFSRVFSRDSTGLRLSRVIYRPRLWAPDIRGIKLEHCNKGYRRAQPLIESVTQAHEDGISASACWQILHNLLSRTRCHSPQIKENNVCGKAARHSNFDRYPRHTLKKGGYPPEGDFWFLR